MRSPEKSFGGFNAERNEGKEKVEALGNFIKATSQEYRENDNIPIGEDGRLDPNQYRSLYNDTAKDVERSRNFQKESFGDVSEEEARQKRMALDGEKLEMLAYAIFYKNLREKFIVTRSSEHDDRINKVDTILLDKETGNLVCAFDEVGDTSQGVDYEKKQAAVRDRNVQRGGAFLKYGLSLVEREGKKTVMPDQNENIPLFYIALPKDRIQKGIAEFLPSQTQQSEFEKKLFEYFIATISLQIQALELYGNRLDEKLKYNIVDFKKIVDGLSRKKAVS